MLLIDVLKQNFSTNELIFIEEIYDLYPGVSRVDIYRMINKSIEDLELLKVDKYMFYIPNVNKIPTIEDLIYRKYISNNGQIRGIYSGYSLKNFFGFVSQTPNIIEIIKNKQSERSKQMTIGGYTVILYKPRCDINKDNYAAYTLLQLFSGIKRLKDISSKSEEIIKKYISQTQLTKQSVDEVAVYFPELPYVRIKAFGYYRYLK